ncbi:MAG: 2-oxoacid:ferredoxin oxidoreductase subunit beta [Spirochaetaceae bacterium]
MKQLEHYLRGRFMPHIWCPGCGHGTVLNGLIRAVDALGLSKNEMVAVSGIGCSARMAGYLDFHTMHTLHGRALAFATGVKLSRPELTIICPMGDGDALAIGGNHFIHAARRNIDITVIILNNRIYGMTGGQFSPTTGCGLEATTAPYSTIDEPFDAVRLAIAAGATFVARTTTYHVMEIEQLLTRAIRHHGFSVVEVLSQCPTHFGRRNQSAEAAEMLRVFKEHTVRVTAGATASSAGAATEGPAAGMSSPGDSAPATAAGVATEPGLIPRGVFVEERRPEYCDEYTKVIERAQGAS